MFYSMPFQIFFLHYPRVGDQLFKRVYKSLIKVSKQMKNLVNDACNRNPLELKRLTTVIAVITSTCSSAVFTNLI